MKKILILAAVSAAAILSAGCGHNALQYSDGIGLELGFIPEQYQVAVNFRYGKILSAVVKEKAEVTLESSGGLATDVGTSPQAADTQATTRLTLKTGDQITGYAVELEEAKVRASSAK